MQTLPIALTVPAPGAGGSPQKATLFIQVTNGDGTAPTLAPDPNTHQTDVTILTQPVANDGSNPSFPVANFPYMGVIAANVAGEMTVDLLADGVVDEAFDVTVTVAQPEVANVPSTAIVIS